MKTKNILQLTSIDNKNNSPNNFYLGGWCIKYEDIKLILRRFIKEIKKHLKKQGISETALKILDKNRQTLYTCFFLKSFKDKISISIE